MVREAPFFVSAANLLQSGSISLQGLPYSAASAKGVATRKHMSFTASSPSKKS